MKYLDFDWEQTNGEKSNKCDQKFLLKDPNKQML